MRADGKPGMTDEEVCLFNIPFYVFLLSLNAQIIDLRLAFISM